VIKEVYDKSLRKVNMEREIEGEAECDKRGMTKILEKLT